MDLKKLQLKNFFFYNKIQIKKLNLTYMAKISTSYKIDDILKIFGKEENKHISLQIRFFRLNNIQHLLSFLRDLKYIL